MRLIVWGLVIVALGYAAYSGMISIWSYISVATSVDEVFQKARTGGRPDVGELREMLLKTTNEGGVPLTERDVTVLEGERSIQVQIVWSVPVVVYKGEVVLAVPLSVKRTLEVAEGAPATTSPPRRLAPRR